MRYRHLAPPADTYGPVASSTSGYYYTGPTDAYVPASYTVPTYSYPADYGYSYGYPYYSYPYYGYGGGVYSSGRRETDFSNFRGSSDFCNNHNVVCGPNTFNHNGFSVAARADSHYTPGSHSADGLSSVHVDLRSAVGARRRASPRDRLLRGAGGGGGFVGHGP